MTIMGWRVQLFGAVLGAAFGLTCGRLVAAAQEKSDRQAPGVPCGPAEIGRVTVSHVVDGRTLVLEDGREVRLAAIEVPPLPLPQETGAAPGGAAAKDGLNALAGGDEVVLRRAEALADRYGRMVAYAYTLRDGEEMFVQGELLASGLARVGDRVGSRTCAADLLNREQAARKAKLGLWADPYYRVLDAEAAAEMLTRQGRFALVEGKVISVRESGSTIYLNFGRRWSQDFSVTVRKRDEKNFAAAGLDVKNMTGRRVRVRGFIETHGSAGTSPGITAERPEQIEMAGSD
jgi:endonuclease YncB( thermonuclease family)